jgi:ABC-type multidrug transport system fused ATPase/permease subunit
LSAGRIVAFLFLVTLFIGPVQVATETINDAQNALAGLRRVLEVIDTPIDVTDPADTPNGGRVLPPGPLDVAFRDVTYAYPGGSPVLAGVNLTIAARARIAVVGETGSGKTTLAKLLTRLMDPACGSIELSGVPLREVPFGDLRARVVMVPQEGHLFEASIADNVRYGKLAVTDAEIVATFDELGLGDWLAGLPRGVLTSVGQRGELLSAGERQLVAVARAHLADPDLLVMDEATSAVDPATEQRLARGLLPVTRFLGCRFTAA